MPIDQHLLVLFVVTTIIAMITPGPDMLFVLGRGMRGGARAGLLATARATRVKFAILGAVLIGLEFLVDGTVGVLAGRIGGWLRRRHAARRRVDIATGDVFIGVGVRLAVER